MTDLQKLWREVRRLRIWLFVITVILLIALVRPSDTAVMIIVYIGVGLAWLYILISGIVESREIERDRKLKQYGNLRTSAWRLTDLLRAPVPHAGRSDCNPNSD